MRATYLISAGRREAGRLSGSGILRVVAEALRYTNENVVYQYAVGNGLVDDRGVIIGRRNAQKI